MFTEILTGSTAGPRYHLFMNNRREQWSLLQGAVPGYCGRPSSSLTQCIFSVTHMWKVGANALRSSNAASATPTTAGFFRQANSRVPQALQKTRSSASDEA